MHIEMDYGAPLTPEQLQAFISDGTLPGEGSVQAQAIAMRADFIDDLAT
jgi:hypothetical protein